MQNRCYSGIGLEWITKGASNWIFNWIFNVFFLGWVGKYMCVYYVIMYEFHNLKKCFKPNIEEME